MNLKALLTSEPHKVVDGVCDFVTGDEDYCDNFGEQWNRFRGIQIDSLSGSTESHDRFFAETGWKSEDLKGKVVLDAGCGAGRFAEVAMECGARVVAVDLSEAVWACKKTLERFPSEDYLVVRASLFNLPFKPRSFDYIYSLGVLQHTPDPLGAIRSLVPWLKREGEIAVWIYERRSVLLDHLQPKPWVRLLVSDWSMSSKLKLSQFLTAVFFPAGWALSWFGRAGEYASRLLPYAARHHLGRGDLKRQWDYCVMDTIDWYGPAFDDPMREEDVTLTMEGAGLGNIARLPARGMAIKGTRI